MKRRIKIRLEILGLCCSVIAVSASAIPLFNRANDAQLFLLFFGAIGIGATLSNLIRDIRQDKHKEEQLIE